MNNNNNDYIGLFNEDAGFNVDNISIKLNNDNNIYVDQVDYNLIKSDLPFIILATDISNNTIETKLTNNYIVDDTINQAKIVNLVSNLLAINNKFLDYYLKTDTYTQNEINTLFYTKTQSDGKYALITSLSNYVTNSSLSTTLSSYVLSSFLTSNYFTQTQINNRFASYYSQTEINLLLNNYVLLTALSNYVTNSSLSTTLSNYVLTSFLTSNYFTQTQINDRFASYYSQTEINLLLNNYLSLTTYNTDQSNLALKFFSPLSSGNLRKAYLEYADLTSTKYIFFSQNGTNQYQTINFIDNNTLQSSKLVNNSIGQTQLDTTFYDNALYCYDNFVNSNGLLSLASLNPPSVSGTYYLRSFLNLAGLNQVSWVDVSTLSNNIVLPYTISTNISGYNSVNNGAVFKLSQTANPTTSTGIEIAFENTGQSNCYGSTGFNSSGRIVVNPSLGTFIQYPAPFCYAYSKSNYYIFCYNSLSSVVNVRIQCLDDIINIWSSLSMNNWDLNNVRKLYITDLYPNTTNQTYIKVNSDLQITNILKCDTLQGYSATNLIKFNNDVDHNNLNVAKVNNIFCSIINANSVNNNLIKFNNTCDHQNNLITNYNLEYQSMTKTTSGSIGMKISNLNTYASWDLMDSADNKGIGIGIYKPTTGNTQSYITTNKDFYFGNSTILYYKVLYATTRVTFDMFGNDINMNTAGTIYTNYLRNATTGYFIDTYNMRMKTNLDMGGFTLTNFTFPAANLTTSDNIPVNTGNVNFLTKSSTTVNNITMYGLDSNSFIIQNNASENCGMGLCSNQDNISFWSATDSNNFMSFVDEDVGTTRFGGINGSAAIFVGSSRLRKHSIREKKNNNVLDRIMKLKVCSYGLKYNIDENDNEKKNQRKINKASKQKIGLILEDTYKLFSNVCSFYENKLEDDLIDDENIKGKKTTFKNKPKLEDVNLLNEGIIYETVNLYHLMAFQEFVKKTDERFNNLKINNNQNINNTTIDNDLITRNSLYINDRLDEIKARIDNLEYNNLRPDEVYRIKNIINTQDEIYKCINDDIKKVKLDNEILRDKHIDTIETNTIINKNLNEKIINLESKINTYEEDIKFLKEENAKFKIALKMLMDKNKK